jgi:hypothetical protein
MTALPGVALPRPHLVDQWRAVLAKAWSIRLILIAGLLDGTSTVMSMVSAHPPIPLGLFAGLSFLVSAGALVARLVAQKNLRT